jgi:hypothetical protein
MDIVPSEIIFSKFPSYGVTVTVYFTHSYGDSLFHP